MTRMQSSTGLAINLAEPDLSMIDIEKDIAGPLSRLARFGGHRVEVPGEALPHPYTVAQHCVVGADALLEETGDVVAALAFLLHDAHEALIGDITTPVKDALAHYVDVALRVVYGTDRDQAHAALGTSLFEAALAEFKRSIDRRIHRLVGLPETLPQGLAETVKTMDLRMLDLERRQILGPTTSAPYDDIWCRTVRKAAPVRIRGRLTPWPRKKAAAEWMRRFDAWRIRPTAVVSPVSPIPRRDGAAVAA